MYFVTAGVRAGGIDGCVFFLVFLTRTRFTNSASPPTNQSSITLVPAVPDENWFGAQWLDESPMMQTQKPRNHSSETVPRLHFNPVQQPQA